jgi:outer membrane autotransporter protein
VTQTLIDQVATASDVNAALAQLTPTAFQSFTTIGVNNSFQTTQLLGQRLFNARQGALPFDVAGMEAIAFMQDSDRSRRSLLPPGQGPFGTSEPLAADAFSPSAPAVELPSELLAIDRKSARSGPGVFKAPPAARAADPDAGWGMFLYGNAIFARQGATANSPTSRFTTTGVTFGVDRRFTPNFLAGVFGGYSHTNADLDDIGSTTKIKTWLVGTYASYYHQNLYVNGAFIYGSNAYESTRMALGTSNTSDPHGDQFAVQGAVGADYRFGNWIVTPELGAQFTTVRVEGFTETGPAALAVQADRADSFRSSLGARVQYERLTAWGLLIPEWRVSWQHEFLDKERDVRASFVDQAFPGTFATTTAGAGRDFGVFGTGLSAAVAERSLVSINYDFKIGDHDFTAHQISGRLRHLF